MLIFYRVNYFDELENKSATASGLVAAKDWNDAIEQLKMYYGDDNIVNFFLEEWDAVAPFHELEEAIKEYGK